jgi:hypothetical protein
MKIKALKCHLSVMMNGTERNSLRVGDLNNYPKGLKLEKMEDGVLAIYGEEAIVIPFANIPYWTPDLEVTKKAK